MEKGEMVLLSEQYNIYAGAFSEWTRNQFENKERDT